MPIKIITKELNIKTSGTGDLVDITDYIEKELNGTGFCEGNVVVFVIGSTAAITTFEYERGLISDMRNLYEKLIPSNKSYLHDETWQDANGFSHLRAAIQGPSLVIPFKGKRLLLGTWQQVVLAEFDTRARSRRVILQFIGE